MKINVFHKVGTHFNTKVFIKLILIAGAIFPHLFSIVHSLQHNHLCKKAPF